MADRLPKISGAGIACLDYIFTAPQIPWGGTALISSYLVQGGGLVATALVACARLGAECSLISFLGDDEVGDQIMAEFLDEGIDTEGVERVEGESAFSIIHVDERLGERTIFHRGATGLDEWVGFVSLDAVSDSDVLLIDDVYMELSLVAAKAARCDGVPVVADLIPGPGKKRLLRLVDVLIAPRHFAAKMGWEGNLDAALDAIHEMGPRTAVITLGADGWVYSGPEGRGQGKAFEVDVVDTTGAGDVFHGAFAYGLAMGWDTGRCCEFAGAAAAIKCTGIGGRSALPELPDVMDFLRERSKLEWGWSPRN